jgi:RES domain-containing protein
VGEYRQADFVMPGACPGHPVEPQIDVRRWPDHRDNLGDDKISSLAEYSRGFVDTVAYSHAWLISRRTVSCMMPSIIVPESFNILINPAHTGALSISISSIRSFKFGKHEWSPA